MPTIYDKDTFALPLFFVALAVSLSALADSPKPPESITEGVKFHSDPSDNSVSHYSKAQIQHMQGQSALDIIRQIPGFTFVDSTNQRGLSNAAGNVLIRGLPILNKSQSLGDFLANIPAEQISAIVVYLAGHSFSSVTQHTQVVNLIRSQSSREMNWRLSTLAQAGEVKPQSLSLQARAQWLNWEHLLQMQSENECFRSTSDFIETSPTATLFQTGHEIYEEQDKNAHVNLTASKVFSSSRLQVNTQWLTSRYQEAYFRQLTEHEQPLSKWIHQHNNAKQFELGFDWRETPSDQPSDWLWNVIGFMRRENTDEHAATRSLTERSSDATNAVLVDPFEQKKTLTEQVVNITRQHAGLWWQPEMGAEFSRNHLQADTRVPSITSTTVKETRIEPFIASQLSLGEHWQVYARLTFEYATLSSRAKQDYEVSNQYLKPLVRLSHQPRDGLSSTLTLQRQIEQLDFDAFVAIQDVNFGRSQSGNTQLNPEQRIELSYELNYEPDAAWSVNTRLFGQARQDIHEVMQFDESSSGIGNVGDATRYGARVNITRPIQQLITGGQINVEYEYSDSEFDDPMIGRRQISWIAPHVGNVALRVNREDYAWGISVHLPETYTAYYPDEEYREHINAFVNLFAEFTLFQDIQLAIRVTDAFGGRYRYERDFYETNRTGEVDSLFVSKERNKPLLSVSFRGTF